MKKTQLFLALLGLSLALLTSPAHAVTPTPTPTPFAWDLSGTPNAKASFELAETWGVFRTVVIMDYVTALGASPLPGQQFEIEVRNVYGAGRAQVVSVDADGHSTEVDIEAGHVGYIFSDANSQFMWNVSGGPLALFVRWQQ